MRWRVDVGALIVSLAACGACGRYGFDTTAKTGADGGGDAAPVRCDPLRPFATPTPLPVLSSADAEIGLELTDDQLEGFMWSDRSGSDQLYATRRAAIADPFALPETLPTLASAAPDRDPCPSGDGLNLVFSSLRPGAGGWDLWMSRRPTRTTAFETPEALGSLNSADANWGPYLTSSALGLYYVEGTDLRVAYRPSTSTLLFAAPIVLDELNTSDAEFEPTVTPDELTILFASSRPGGRGGLGTDESERGQHDRR
jgi:hypothetical protein